MRERFLGTLHSPTMAFAQSAVNRLLLGQLGPKKALSLPTNRDLFKYGSFIEKNWSFSDERAIPGNAHPFLKAHFPCSKWPCLSHDLSGELIK